MGPGPARGPDELVAGASDGAPRHRRGIWLVVLLLAGVTVALVRPELALHADRAAERSEGTPTDDARDAGGWRPRGDLVSDTAFVEAATERVTRERPDATQLLFAGRMPEGSRLAVLGSDGTDDRRGFATSSARAYALLIPQGAEVGSGIPAPMTGVTDPQQLLTWAARVPGDRVLALAMTRPGPVSFEVSSRVRFGSDGSAQRLWSPAYAEDGVVVQDLGQRVDPIVTVRVLGPGFTSVPLVTRVVTPVPPQRLLHVAGVDTATYRGPDTPYLSHALEAGAGSVADLDSAHLELLWSATLPRARKLALVLVTRDDGQRFQALVGQQGDAEFQAGVRPLPRGESDRLPWLFTPSTPQDPTLLLCPTGPGSLVYRRAGQPDHVLPIDGSGVASLIVPGSSPPSASGARVTLRDPNGEVLLRTTLPEPGFDDPLALD